MHRCDGTTDINSGRMHRHFYHNKFTQQQLHQIHRKKNMVKIGARKLLSIKMKINKLERYWLKYKNCLARYLISFHPNPHIHANAIPIPLHYSVNVCENDRLFETFLHCNIKFTPDKRAWRIQILLHRLSSFSICIFFFNFIIGWQ